MVTGHGRGGCGEADRCGWKTLGFWCLSGAEQEPQKMCFSITLAENYPGEKRAREWNRREAVKDEVEIKTIILLSCFWGRPQHHPPAEVE